MHRTEMYIRKDQVQALQDIAYIKTRENGKRIGVSQLVREAIDHWLKDNSDMASVVIDSGFNQE